MASTLSNDGPGIRTADFDYDLPDELVARYPATERDGSRLLVVDPRTRSVSHHRFPDLVGLLRPGDVVVVNDTRVFPARLVGRKPTGAPAEVLLLSPIPDEGGGKRWEALVRPGSKLKPGRTIEVGEDLVVRILDSASGGGRVVELVTDLDLGEALARHGRVPLPPYLGREAEGIDKERYQTVYADTDGSVAAPTAGLHFTPEVMAEIRARGIDWASVTLHVGVGTFRPVDTDDPSEHVMHRERYTVSEAAAERIAAGRERGGRVWAVGTTVVRTLESAATTEGGVAAGSGSTDLFIRPPWEFRVVDGLLTNFHLPRSTLLMLVAALAGTELIHQAYLEAIRHRYRFYSYGDAMIVLPR